MVTAGDGYGNLEGLAARVLSRYPLHVLDISTVQAKGKKVVWRVRAREGHFCLKRLGKRMDSLLFSVGAQKYMQQKGALVPAVLAGEDGEITVVGADAFVVYQWVEGRPVSFGTPESLRQAVRGLAAFHRHSKGYVPPRGARVSQKWDRWPQQYASILQRLRDWLEAAGRESGAFAGAFREEAPFFIRRGEKVLAALSRSGYQRLARDPARHLVLCHQDYGEGNALLTPRGVYVLDLDNVSFDFPARDLRKLINKVATAPGGWKVDRGRQVLRYYNEEEPLGEEMEELVWLDLAFPHLFHDVAKNHFKKGKDESSLKLREAARVERAKSLGWLEGESGNAGRTGSH